MFADSTIPRFAPLLLWHILDYALMAAGLGTLALVSLIMAVLIALPEGQPTSGFLSVVFGSWLICVYVVFASCLAQTSPAVHSGSGILFRRAPVYALAGFGLLSSVVPGLFVGALSMLAQACDALQLHIRS